MAQPQYNWNMQVEAMHLYIVQGYSSTDINGKVDGLYNYISKTYNLNYCDKGDGRKQNYSSGHHRAKYKKGYRNPNTGKYHEVTRNVLSDYMKSYLNGSCENLEDFLYDYFDEDDEDYVQSSMRSGNAAQAYTAAQRTVKPAQALSPVQRSANTPTPITPTTYSGGSSSGGSFSPSNNIVKGGVLGIIVVILLICVILFGKSCSRTGSESKNDDNPFADMEQVFIYVNFLNSTAGDCTMYVSDSITDNDDLSYNSSVLTAGEENVYHFLSFDGSLHKIYFEADGKKSKFIEIQIDKNSTEFHYSLVIDNDFYLYGDTDNNSSSNDNNKLAVEITLNNSLIEKGLNGIFILDDKDQVGSFDTNGDVVFDGFLSYGTHKAWVEIGNMTSNTVEFEVSEKELSPVFYLVKTESGIELTYTPNS